MKRCIARKTRIGSRCERVSQQASRARGVTVGDIIDGTLEFVRRHPATGLLAVGVVGFLLGRSTRR